MYAGQELGVTSLCNYTAASLMGGMYLSASNGYVGLKLDSNNSAFLYAAKDIDIKASNDSTFVSLSNLTINGVQSNVVVGFSNASKSLNTYSACNTTMTVGQNFGLTSACNVSITATASNITLVANASKSTIVMNSNVRIVASNDFLTYSSNNTVIYSSNDAVISAGDQSVTITMSNAAETLDVYSGGKTTFVAVDDFTASSTTKSLILNASLSMNMNAHNDSMYIRMNDTSDSITTYALKSVNINTGSNIVGNAASNIFMGASNNVTIFASNAASLLSSNQMDIQSSNVLIQMRKDDGIFTRSAKNISMTTSNLFSMSASNLLGYANVTMSNDGDLLMTSCNQTISFAGLNNVIGSSNGTVVLETGGNNSNVTVTLKNSDYTFNLAANSNINMSSLSNGFVVNTFNSNGYISLSNDITKHLLYKSQASNFDFIAEGNNILSITQSNVIIRGNLQIEGVFDSTNIQQTNLYVEDKQIVLAAASNGQDPLYDDDTPHPNDKAGVVVNGVPSATLFSATADQTIAEKSIRWNYGTNGINAINAADAGATESYWEMIGGSFHLSAPQYVKDGTGKITGLNTTHGKVTFGFRINDHQELEIVKILYGADGVTPSGAPVKVARFGKTI